MKKFIFPLLTLLLTACGKNPEPIPEDTRAYSHWQIGNDSFKTNNVTKYFGNPGGGLSYRDSSYSNGFDITFRFEPAPMPCDFPFAMGPLQGDSVVVNFYYRNIQYEPYRSGFLHRDTGRKFQVSLSPTWFVNFNNPNDTVLISGMFSEP